MAPPARQRKRWIWLAVGSVVVAIATIGVLPWIADRATTAAGSQPTTSTTEALGTTSTVATTTTGAGTAPPSTTEPETTTTTAAVDAFDVTRLVDSGDPEFDAAIIDAAVWLEDARGLAFRRPVTVVLMDDDPFIAELTQDLEEDREDIEDTEGILVALGLLDPGLDLYDTFAGLLGAGVVGFYDPEVDRLVLRATSGLTESTKATLVHELVHALEDQWFELERPELENDPEAQYSFQMLAEGSARYIENQYVSSLSGAQRRALINEQIEFSSGVDFSVFPQYLLDITFAPYEIGPGFVSNLLTEFGFTGLDEAFATPPSTTEQVLFFNKYRQREPAIVVPQPTADGEVFDDGSLGLFDLLLLLQSELSSGVAATAAEGWGGDRYVAWNAAGETCIRFTMVGDTDRDTAEIADALTNWADARGPAATVAIDAGVPTVTACSG